MRITLVDAIYSLSPEAKVEIVGQQVYENINWLDDLPVHPTKEETETRQAEMQADFDALDYARNRASAKGYPSIGDQLDMQYWDQVNGTTTWQDAVAKVKADNPK